MLASAARQEGVVTRTPLGMVKVVTAAPVLVPRGEDGAVIALRRELNRRPWIVPAALLCAGVTYLLARGR